MQLICFYNSTEPVVPDGLDPSFLAALPENIRQEVIADHLRLQRIQQRTHEQQSAVTPGGMEVNLEFIAALPPNIQEEVSTIRIVNIDKMALKKIL